MHGEGEEVVVQGSNLAETQRSEPGWWWVKAPWWCTYVICIVLVPGDPPAELSTHLQRRGQVLYYFK